MAIALDPLTSSLPPIQRYASCSDPFDLNLHPSTKICPLFAPRMHSLSITSRVTFDLDFYMSLTGCVIVRCQPSRNSPQLNNHNVTTIHNHNNDNNHNSHGHHHITRHQKPTPITRCHSSLLPQISAQHCAGYALTLVCFTTLDSLLDRALSLCSQIKVSVQQTLLCCFDDSSIKCA